jgi:uncharacterized membrane protein
MKKEFVVLIIAGCLVLLDSIYLRIMKNAFNKQIMLIQGSSIQLNMFAAIGCYISLIFGLYYFIIREKRSIKDAFLLGIVIYSVYDLTTLALLKKWSPMLSLIDSVWGGILFALTTAIVYRITLNR